MSKFEKVRHRLNWWLKNNQDIPQLEKEVIDIEDCLAELDAVDKRIDELEAEVKVWREKFFDYQHEKGLEIMNSGMTIDKLEAENKRYREFIKDAPCPFCDGSGAIRTGEDDWEQCRWCCEREIALKAGEK